MASPVYNALFGNTQPQSEQLIDPAWVNLFSTLRRSPNPNMMFQQMMMQNPKIQQVMAYINQCGGDPRAVFLNAAQQKRIDPNRILSLLNRA